MKSKKAIYIMFCMMSLCCNHQQNHLNRIKEIDKIVSLIDQAECFDEISFTTEVSNEGISTDKLIGAAEFYGSYASGELLTAYITGPGPQDFLYTLYFEDNKLIKAITVEGDSIAGSGQKQYYFNNDNILNELPQGVNRDSLEKHIKALADYSLEITGSYSYKNKKGNGE